MLEAHHVVKDAPLEHHHQETVARRDPDQVHQDRLERQDQRVEEQQQHEVRDQQHQADQLRELPEQLVPVVQRQCRLARDQKLGAP